jgi:acyl carrier protein
MIVGRGYLDRPVLTAQKFVPNPHNPGERLYRTGDRARWLASGDVEFLGRLDHQVKIRGVRIEPSEVESALAGRVGVARVVVLAREDSPGQKRLVAYVVPRPGTSLTAAELRRHAREKLPDYMVPSAFVVLDGLPLSPNGKVDRNALPTPEAVRQGRPEERTAPRDGVEQVVASIWSEVLGSGPIGVHESFFDLGGHSLLATQVVSRLRDAFQIELPLRRLFEAPTVAELSASLATGAEERARLEKGAQLLLQVAGMSDAEVDAMSRQQVPA